MRTHPPHRRKKTKKKKQERGTRETSFEDGNGKLETFLISIKKKSDREKDFKKH